jgi:hypothetical protein
VIQDGLSFFTVMYLFGIVLILNAKQSYFDKIYEKINTETNGSKNWWNLVKSLLHSDSGGDRSIPSLQVENDAASKIVFVIVLVITTYITHMLFVIKMQMLFSFCYWCISITLVFPYSLYNGEKAKKTNTIGQWEKFRKIRNKCNKLILNAKQSYFDKIYEKINTETNNYIYNSHVICY